MITLISDMDHEQLRQRYLYQTRKQPKFRKLIRECSVDILANIEEINTDYILFHSYSWKDAEFAPIIHLFKQNILGIKFMKFNCEIMCSFPACVFGVNDIEILTVRETLRWLEKTIGELEDFELLTKFGIATEIEGLRYGGLR